jgi:hypothetical protein
MAEKIFENYWSKKMSELDSKIHQALMDITDADLQMSDENSTYEDLVQTYHNQYKKFLIAAGFKYVASIAVWAFCVYQFFQQEDVRSMIAYASGAIMCSVVLAAVAIFLLQELNKNILNREIKRLELQVALLIKYIKTDN